MAQQPPEKPHVPNEATNEVLKEEPTPSMTSSQDKLTDVLGLLTGQFDLTPPFARRIFVNRTLRLDRIAWIGFDMDFTLVRYRDEEMGPLLYQQARDKLVAAGYDASLGKMAYDPSRAMRGILIDKEQGNLLQMNRHRHVNTAYLGHQKLNKEERRQYRVDPLQLSVSDDGYSRFRLIDTQFGIPEAALYADVIAWHHEHQPDASLNYNKLYDDVRHAMDTAHADLSIHHAVVGDLQRYIKPDPELATMLRRFRMWGKKLFLLTNSDWEYTDAAMTFLLGEEAKAHQQHWTSFFDLVGVRASKPSFFASTSPFELLNVAGETIETVDQLPTAPYDVPLLVRGGNHKALHQYLDVEGERVIYVGDHIYGDILRTRRASTWRTMFVMDEFEKELEQLQAVQQALGRWRQLTEQRDHIDAAIHHQAMLLERLQMWVNATPNSEETTLQEQLSRAAIEQAERLLEQLQNDLDRVITRAEQLHDEIHERFNPQWGMLFREGHASSYLAEQVRKFACMYTSRATNFLYYAPTQYFRPPRNPLAHEHALESRPEATTKT